MTTTTTATGSGGRGGGSNPKADASSPSPVAPANMTTANVKSNNDTTTVSPSCRSCVDLLQAIFTGGVASGNAAAPSSSSSPPSSSRSLTLLRALFNDATDDDSSLNEQSQQPLRQLTWRRIDDGIQVQIPAEEATVPYQHYDNNSDNSDHHLQGEWGRQRRGGSMLQATSSARQSHDGGGAADEMNNRTEWLSIRCKKCGSTGPEGGARAFIMGPNTPEVVICTNRLEKRPGLGGHTAEERLREMEEMLTHEFVHLYDVRKLRMDLSVCQNLAYSEVRAAAAAECLHLRDKNDKKKKKDDANQAPSAWPPNPFAGGPSSLFATTERKCVRQKALNSTQNLFPSSGNKCMQAVFEKALRDRRPFAAPPSPQKTKMTTTTSSSGSTATTSTTTTAPQQQQQQQPTSDR